MQKRQTFNLILLFIVVIAIVLLQLDDKDSQTQQKFSISTLTADVVKQIHVERRDYPDMIFLRENDDWMMTEPYHTRAAGHRIQGILDILTSRSKHQLPVKKIDLVQTGLIEPELRLILDNSWFEFGGVNPLDEHRYLLHNDTVHLIHDTLYPQLMTSPTFFIDNKLFANASGIRSIQFRQGTIQQDISGNWQFSGESELSSEALKERILHWQTLQANSVQKAQDCLRYLQ